MIKLVLVVNTNKFGLPLSERSQILVIWPKLSEVNFKISLSMLISEDLSDFTKILSTPCM